MKTSSLLVKFSKIEEGYMVEAIGEILKLKRVSSKGNEILYEFNRPEETKKVCVFLELLEKLNKEQDYWIDAKIIYK